MRKRIHVPILDGKSKLLLLAIKGKFFHLHRAVRKTIFFKQENVSEVKMPTITNLPKGYILDILKKNCFVLFFIES